MNRGLLSHRRARIAFACAAVVIGALFAVPPASAAGFCNQTGNLRFGPNPVAQGAPFFLTGITCPHTGARFRFFDQQGNKVDDRSTRPSRGNCVIHHEPETYPMPLAPGSYRVEGDFLDDFCQFRGSVQLGNLVVVRAPCNRRCDEGTLDRENCVCNCFEGADENCQLSGGIFNYSTCTCTIFDPCRDRICPPRDQQSSEAPNEEAPAQP